MDIKDKLGSTSLLGVTEYGNRLPIPAGPSRLSVEKEMKRMEAEKDSLNAMEKTEPNPLYKDKKAKAKSKLTVSQLKNMTQEELDELLASLAKSEAEQDLDIIRSMAETKPQEEAGQSLLDKYAEKLSAPKFEGFRAPTTYRSPGFFQG